MKLANPFSRLRAEYDNKSDPESMRSLARSYWHLLTSVALCVCVLVCVLGGFLIVRTLHDVNLPPTQAAPQKNAYIRHDDLTNLLSTFNDRQSQFNTLSTGSTTPMADPSK